MMYNEDERLFQRGRQATGCAIVGMLSALVVSTISHLPVDSGVIVVLLFFYSGLSGYWGAHVFHEKSRRLKYKVPGIVFRFLQMVIIVLGAIIGLVGYGLYEHFILLLSVQTRYNTGFFSAQIILTPGLGKYFQRRSLGG